MNYLTLACHYCQGYQSTSGTYVSAPGNVDDLHVSVLKKLVEVQMTRLKTTWVDWCSVFITSFLLRPFVNTRVKRRVKKGSQCTHFLLLLRKGRKDHIFGATKLLPTSKTRDGWCHDRFNKGLKLNFILFFRYLWLKNCQCIHVTNKSTCLEPFIIFWFIVVIYIFFLFSR